MVSILPWMVHHSLLSHVTFSRTIPTKAAIVKVHKRLSADKYQSSWNWAPIFCISIRYTRWPGQAKIVLRVWPVGSTAWSIITADYGYRISVRDNIQRLICDFQLSPFQFPLYYIDFLLRTESPFATGFKWIWMHRLNLFRQRIILNRSRMILWPTSSLLSPNSSVTGCCMCIVYFSIVLQLLFQYPYLVFFESLNLSNACEHLSCQSHHFHGWIT